MWRITHRGNKDSKARTQVCYQRKFHSPLVMACIHNAHSVGLRLCIPAAFPIDQRPCVFTPSPAITPSLIPVSSPVGRSNPLLKAASHSYTSVCPHCQNVPGYKRWRRRAACPTTRAPCLGTRTARARDGSQVGPHTLWLT